MPSRGAPGALDRARTPLGDDAAGDFLRAALEAEGVTLVRRRTGRTATTVVMPVADDRAMVTLDPGVRASAAEVAALEPRAVAANVDMLHAVPEGCGRTSPAATTTPAPLRASRCGSSRACTCSS